MKTPKMFHLVVLLVIAVAPFFFPAPAEAVSSDTPWFLITGPSNFKFYTGKYENITFIWKFCNGDTGEDTFPRNPYEEGFGSTPFHTIRAFTVEFHNSGSETISGSTDYCEPPKPSHCGGFSIPKRVPRSPAVPVSFKGPGNITSANIYFKNLKYSLSLWLHRYDWGSKTWYGYLNTMLLPLGKHHGRVTTYVDGVRGGGCATGGFKVVED
jgi:hypothetical protein